MDILVRLDCFGPWETRDVTDVHSEDFNFFKRLLRTREGVKKEIPFSITVTANVMFEKRYTGFNDQVGFFELIHASVTKCSYLLASRFFFSDVPYAPTHLAWMPFHHQPGYPSPTFVLTIRVYPKVSQDGSWLKGRCWEYLRVDVNVMRGHGWSELGSSPNKKSRGNFLFMRKFAWWGEWFLQVLDVCVFL